jgi:lysozyme
VRSRIWLAAAAIPGIGLALYVMFDAGFIRFNYPSKEKFPVWGIDVSHHQGRIDWAAVAADKTIRFAYIKASEGGDFRDTRFAENWQKSKAAGLVRGAYHFFTFCRPGKNQAKNFLATVPVEAGTLPIAVDLEFLGNCSARPSPTALIAELNDFLSDVRKVDPRKPVFYVTYEFYDRYLKDNLQQIPDHHLWLRNIYYEPPQKPCERWALWQFGHRGRVDGIAGPVDLNVFCGDRAAFSSLVAATSAD